MWWCDVCVELETKPAARSKLAKKNHWAYIVNGSIQIQALGQLCALDNTIVKDRSLVSLTVQTYFATAGGSTCLNLAKLNWVRPDLYLDQRLQEILSL